jgi:hypothetical protein
LHAHIATIEAAKACDLLAPIHSRFMVGFDTLELKEANALLDEPA